MTFLASRIFWTGVVLLAAFWVVVPWLHQTTMFEVANALAVSLPAAVAITWGNGAWQVLNKRYRNITGGDILILGVVILSAAISFQFGWRWWWRWSGEPEWMLHHTALAFSIYVVALSTGMFLVCKDVERGGIPKRNWVYIGVATGSAIFITMLALIWMSPVY